MKPDNLEIRLTIEAMFNSAGISGVSIIEKLASSIPRCCIEATCYLLAGAERKVGLKSDLRAVKM